MGAPTMGCSRRGVPKMTDKDRLHYLLFYGAVILAGYLTFQIVSPFLVPLGWAGVLAVCVQPVQRRLVAKLGHAKAAAVSMVLVLVLLVFPVWLIVMAIVNEAGQATDALKGVNSITPPPSVLNAWHWLQAHVPYLAPDRIMASVNEAAQRMVGALAAGSGALISGIALVLLDLIITLFALFFVLRDSDAIVASIRALMPFSEDRRDRILKEVGDLIYASVIAGLAVAAVQGLLGGLTFWALGVRAAVVWGTVMAFFALIPVAGAWVVWFPVAIWLLVTGEVTRAVILFAIGAGVIGTVDNVLRPMLLSGRSSMNGLVTLVALLGGVAAFGFIGLIFGPVVIAVTMALLEPARSAPATAGD